MKPKKLSSRAGLVGLAAILALAVDCRGQIGGGQPVPIVPTPPGNPDGGGTTDGGTPITFTPLATAAAVGKVKNLLTGLPATSQEVAQVAADPNALNGLVQGWMAQPEYTAKMTTFFATAFQQNQVTIADFQNQLQNYFAGPGNGPYANRLLENLTEMFARTALWIASNNQPFSNVATTHTFMMTPALANYMALTDDRVTADNGGITSRMLKANPAFYYSLTSDAGWKDVPIDQAIQAMLFYTPQLPKAQPDPALSNPPDASTAAECEVDPRVVGYTLNGYGVSGTLNEALYGFVDSWRPAPQRGCFASGQWYKSDGGVGGYFVDSDFTTWNPVTIRQPNPGEPTTLFYDLPHLRNLPNGELVLNTPRVGYFTTQAFFAGWQTNTSNQARVTVNQTLIAGLNRNFDGSSTIGSLSTAALDSAHAAPGSQCYGCHQTLDPMRQFFRQAYSLSFSEQSSIPEIGLPAAFALYPASDPGPVAPPDAGSFSSGIYALGGFIANHPGFANAWVQKLCTYANSAPCDETDPAFQSLVTSFQTHLNWNQLVVDLFSSPIVTYLSETATADQVGQTYPIARQEHLCALLSSRLNIVDVCGLQATTKVSGELSSVQGIAVSLPSDSYSRGVVQPVLANDPSLFFRTGLENMCSYIADQLIDNGATPRYSSSNPNAAIADFVQNLMGLTTSDRAAGATAILQAHFANAQTDAGVNARVALKSTFVLACISPYVAGIGQ